MTNDEQDPVVGVSRCPLNVWPCLPLPFVIRHWEFVILSSFVIRHSSFVITPWRFVIVMSLSYRRITMSTQPRTGVPSASKRSQSATSVSMWPRNRNDPHAKSSRGGSHWSPSGLDQRSRPAIQRPRSRADPLSSSSCTFSKITATGSSKLAVSPMVDSSVSACASGVPPVQHGPVGGQLAINLKGLIN